jgi:hypothetical protein
MAKPRFLRRHYPHQVQGVRSTFLVDHLSQAAPPHQFLGQIKTDKREVNKGDRAIPCSMLVLRARAARHSRHRPIHLKIVDLAIAVPRYSRELPIISLGNDDGRFERTWQLGLLQ